jgi:hypothetical protein
VERAQEWEWSSLGLRDGESKEGLRLADGPVAIPRNWGRLVNVMPGERDLAKLGNAIRRGCPFGPDEWVGKMAERLGLEGTLRPRGRPKQLGDGGVKVRGTAAGERNKGGRPKTSINKWTRGLLKNPVP